MWSDRWISLSKIKSMKIFVNMSLLIQVHSEDNHLQLKEIQKDIQTLTQVIRQYRAAYPNKPNKQSADENFICYTKETRTPKL